MADDPQISDTQAPDLGDLAKLNAQETVDAFNKKENIGWIAAALGKGILAAVKIVINSTLFIVTKVVSVIQLVFEQGNAGLGNFASTVIGALFGHQVDANIGGGIFGNASADQVSTEVGQSILGAVFGDISGDGGGDISPSTAKGEAFLGSITAMVMRGFLMSTVTEFVSVGQIKLVHELEEELISGLGLGRVARRVLQPFVQILIADPALWALNLSYRPKLLSEGTAVHRWITGQMDGATLDDELGRQGWSSDRIDALVAEKVKRLGVDELRVLVDHGLVEEADALTRINLLGYDTSGAADAWAAARFRRLQGYLEKAAAVWLDKYSSGLIDHDTFVTSVTGLGLPDDVAQAIVNVGGAHVETPRRLLAYSELKDAWNKNLLTQNDVLNYLVRLGYSEEDATTLVLLNLTTIRDKTEADQAKKDAAAAKAADAAATKQAKADAAAAAKAKADQDRQAKAALLAAQKAKVTADKIALQQFALDAAAKKQALVDAQHQAGLVSADAVALAKQQIADDLAALLASIAGQAAESKATFDRQLLELAQANREATVQQQLDDIDLQLEADQAARTTAVGARLQAVADTLAQKLSDLDDLYTARGASIDQDLADGLAAIDVATLPTNAERAAAAQDKIAALDAQLARQLADLAAEFDQRRQVNDDNLANGLIKQTAHDLKVGALQLAQDQAARLAQQQHDLSVARLQGVATTNDPVDTAAADAQRTKLTSAATTQRESLAADKLKATMAAHQAADVETVSLQSIAGQIAPITEATAARKRQKVQAAATAAARQDDVTAAEIAKGEQAAQDALQKASATVQAAKDRLAQAQAAAPARESAQAAATAALTTLQQQLDAQRAELEARLTVDQAGIDPNAAAA